jgi:membrane-associated protease RseP (regulator of RpoE activity)
MVRETPAGRTVKLFIWHDARSRELTVEMGQVPNFIARNVPPDLRDQFDQFRQRMERRFGYGIPDGSYPLQRGAALGVSVQDVSGQFGDYLKVPDGEGALVTNVQSGTPGEKAGLHAGDVIIYAGGQRVHNTAELREQIRGAAAEKPLALRIIRNGSEMTVNADVAKQPDGRSEGRKIPPK